MIKKGGNCSYMSSVEKCVKTFKRSPGGQFTELACLKIFRFLSSNQWRRQDFFACPVNEKISYR